MGDIKDIMTTQDCRSCRHRSQNVALTHEGAHFICLHEKGMRQKIFPNYRMPSWCPLKRMENTMTPDISIPDDTFQPKPPKSETPNIGALVQEYVERRDELSTKRKNFKEIERELKSEMEMLETQILDIQRELGVESISTKGFTAFQTPKTFVRMGDWDTFSKWILDTGNIQCLEKRCAKLACIEVEETDGVDLASIGLEKSKEISIQVRKK